MAHFDSARNRVLWQRELAGLRRERERRQREGYDLSGAGQKSQQDIPSHVRRVTFAELEQMERESATGTLESRGRQRELGQPDKRTPQVKTPERWPQGMGL